MHEGELAAELLRGTELVARFAGGELSTRAFVDAYANFYYFNALDGHEAGPGTSRLLSRFSAACRLHEAVQCEAVDLAYFGTDDPAPYLAAGRILERDVLPRVRQLCESHGLQRVLAQLRAEAERSPKG